MDNTENKKAYRKHPWRGNNSPGIIYGMGFLGALFYYLSHSPTFWIGVLGVLKAIFWPAVILYKVLEVWKL